MTVISKFLFPLTEQESSAQALCEVAPSARIHNIIDKGLKRQFNFLSTIFFTAIALAKKGFMGIPAFTTYKKGYLAYLFGVRGYAIVKQASSINFNKGRYLSAFTTTSCERSTENKPCSSPQLASACTLKYV